MLHEIISKKKTGGNNGSFGVMNYMLKEKDGSPRKGITVLRGDVETQAKLIDSLVGKFKQQYVTGCFSFEESPDQITKAQKNELMDSAEEAICAGLSPDRISITWIEHTDKGRLELNYIVAQVDLEHGRSFQPYVHSHDKDRFNALCTIQNIKHGYSEPNDPAKSQSLKQSPKLPKEVKELKEVLNNHIENLVVDGLINNRDDVLQAFDELGFEPSRQGKDYLSFKRPDGGRNLKFQSSNKEGLYGIEFDSSRKNAKEIRATSEQFRGDASRRYADAQGQYDKELERKQDYNTKRHNKPRLNERTASRSVNPVFSIYERFTGRYAFTVPNPYTDTIRKRNKRNKEKDSEIQQRHDRHGGHVHSGNERVNRVDQRIHDTVDDKSRRTINRSVRDEDKPLSDMGRNYTITDLFGRNHNRSDNNELDNRTAITPLSLQSKWANSPKTISRVIDDEQRTIRPSTAGVAESARNDSNAKTSDRESETLPSTERRRESTIDSIIKSIGRDAKNGVDEFAKEIKFFDRVSKHVGNRLSEIAKTTEHVSSSTIQFERGIDTVNQCTDELSNLSHNVSDRVTRLQDESGRISNEIERVTEQTDRNKQFKNELDEYTRENTASDSRGEQVIEWVTEQAGRIAIAEAEEAKLKPKPSPSFRLGR